MSSSNIFHDLITSYTTWPALSAFLTSEDGGSLRIDDHSTPENPFALIRYMKGKSDLSKPHVSAFRSVIWDTLENRPVSVTAFKSRTGETLPTESPIGDFSLEYFMDGVMIGMFWDKYNKKWRIHTRSTLDARCRYYSQNKTFATMFTEALGSDRDREAVEAALNVNTSYTWILQHPENRIVVPVKAPHAYCTEAITIASNAVVSVSSVPAAAHPVPPLVIASPSWENIAALLADWDRRFGHTIQGLVAKNGFDRFKVRTGKYNVVRRMRGNSARRDYLWLSEWRAGTLPGYLALFPEERSQANATINRWKQATNEIYQMYVAVFKARNTPKTAIPPKYRPLVYGLHNLYLNTLKPAGKSLDWKACLGFMNERDTAQMLFVINWDLRQAMQRVGMTAIPIEPAAAAASTAVTGDGDEAEDAETERPGTPSEVPPVTSADE